jgi:hypothetical protein
MYQQKGGIYLQKDGFTGKKMDVYLQKGWIYRQKAAICCRQEGLPSKKKRFTWQIAPFLQVDPSFCR